MGYICVTAEIGFKQTACQTVPAAVCTTAVNGSAEYIFFIAEQADAVVKSSDKHGIFGHSMLFSIIEKFLSWEAVEGAADRAEASFF